MKEVAVIKDLFRNSPHVLIVRENGLIKTKGLTGYGEEIIKNHVIGDNTGSMSLPAGFVCTGFKQVNTRIQSFLDSSTDFAEQKRSIDDVGKIEVKNNELLRFSGRNLLAQKSLKTDNRILSMSKFRDVDSKINAIDYRAQSFRSKSRTSSVLSPIKGGKISFDERYSRFVPRKNNPLSSFSAEKAEVKVTSGSMRRFFVRNSDIDTKTANRRAIRRSKNLSPVSKNSEMAKKSIGLRISSSIFARLNRNG